MSSNGEENTHIQGDAGTHVGSYCLASVYADMHGDAHTGMG